MTDLWQVHFESKLTERLNIYKAMEQAIDDLHKLRDKKGLPALAAIPAVIHRSNRQPWLVTVRADDLACFARAIVDVMVTDGIQRDPLDELDRRRQ